MSAESPAPERTGEIEQQSKLTALVDDLRGELRDRAGRLDLSPAAQVELGRLLEDGADDALRAVVEHLRGATRLAEQYPSVEVDDDTGALIIARADELARERDARELAHVERIEAGAYRLGRAVARGEITVEDAARRLDAVAHQLDDDLPVPVALVPYQMAEDIACAAYAAGVRFVRKVA